MSDPAEEATGADIGPPETDQQPEVKVEVEPVPETETESKPDPGPDAGNSSRENSTDG